jgi:hypothetical protein
MGWNRADGGPIVAGKNLMWDIEPKNEVIYSADVDWNDVSWPPDNYPDPWTARGASWTDSCSLILYPPIEDWDFEFCKRSDRGGEVTWHV